MKKEDLFQAIGEIPESYINEAHQNVKKSRTSWMKWTAVAACLCLVAVAAFVFPQMMSYLFPAEDKTETDFEVTVSYVGWADVAPVFEEALNADKANDANEKHYPIFRIDTQQEFDDFKAKYSAIWSLNQGYADSMSFEEQMKKAQYYDTYFQKKSLLIIYVDGNSSLLEFGVKGVDLTENSVCVHIEQFNQPEIVTDDMAGWLITVGIPDSKLATCTEFDAR